MSKKKHIVLVGMPGSGKSSTGFILAKLMWRPFVDTDYYIIKKQKKTIAELFAEQGEDSFRKMEKQVLAEIIANSPSVIATGGGLPCFHGNMDVINEFAVSVYLEASPEKLLERLKNGKKRPLLTGKTPEELANYLNTSLQQRKPYYEKANITVQAHEVTTTQLAMNLFDLIKSLEH
jgi:shikimate kinase